MTAQTNSQQIRTLPTARPIADLSPNEKRALLLAGAWPKTLRKVKGWGVRVKSIRIGCQATGSKLSRR
jgi:hypothetical protein